MKSPLIITCERIRTSDLLLWHTGRRKWRVTVTNDTDSTLYISWSEAFVNPFDNKLWINRIDQSPQAGNQYITQEENVQCTSFRTSGDKDRFIAPDKFLQIAVKANQIGSWVMGRIPSSLWDGFHLHDKCLIYQIEKLKRVPIPVKTIMPRFTGWWWA